LLNNKKKLITPSPHIHSEISVQKIMVDVIIALLPAVFAGIYFFGIRVGFVLLLSIASAVCSEVLYQKVTKQEIAVWDLSAVITGLLLGLNLPPAVPAWIPIIGSFFAIIVAKQLFGGLGQNFINPALAGRAFLLISYPDIMTTWVLPVRNIFSSGAVDAVSVATPLSLLKSGELILTVADYSDAFIGNISGSIGETSALALIIGGLYLLFRKVITWHTPLAYIVVVYALTTFISRSGGAVAYPLYEILTGGLLLGAIFMATDYSSSPLSGEGRLIMGIGCGILTVIIRTYGGYPEGVMFAILLMNLSVPLIDRYVRPKVYGGVRK
jgi:electron transport complex protein RnfD